MSRTAEMHGNCSRGCSDFTLKGEDGGEAATACAAAEPFYDWIYV